MKKIVLVFALLVSVGFGSTVYALPIFHGAGVGAQAGADCQFKCKRESCTSRGCTSCTVVGTTPDGDVIL